VVHLPFQFDSVDDTTVIIVIIIVIMNANNALI